MGHIFYVLSGARTTVRGRRMEQRTRASNNVELIHLATLVRGGMLRRSISTS